MKTAHQHLLVAKWSTRKKLPPVRQNFEFFKLGTEYCFHNLKTKKWLLKEALCYLNSLGINEKYSKEITDEARRAWTNTNNPNGPQHGGFAFPGTWIGTSALNDSIDTPMHQVFQGCVKSLIELISKWLKRGTGAGVGKFTVFGDSTRHVLLQVQHLQLDWIRVWPFSISSENRDYTTGGWVGENYLAFARLFKVVYGGYVQPIVGQEAQALIEFWEACYSDSGYDCPDYE